METEAIRKLLPVIDGFPRPDWEDIYNSLENAPEGDGHKAWCHFARTWLDVLAECVGSSYSVSETDNFLILSSMSNRELELLKTFVEEARGTILKKLKGIANDDGFGKHVLFLFSANETYERYKSHTYPDDEVPPDYDRFLDDWVLTADDDIQDYQAKAVSTGLFLDEPYGQLVFSYADLFGTQAVFAREFTHAVLCKYEMPLWLKVGLAETLEHEICRSNPLSMDVSSIANHIKFWDADTIQEFWSGESFGRPDAGSQLSYELAQYCLQSLSHEIDEFIEFANQANWKDAGEEAAIEIFGGSLGGLPFQFFGEGDWIPKPETWSSDEEE